MMFFVLLFACIEAETEKSVEEEPQSPVDFLKIEEVYYSGSVLCRSIHTAAKHK